MRPPKRAWPGYLFVLAASVFSAAALAYVVIANAAAGEWLRAAGILVLAIVGGLVLSRVQRALRD